MKAFILFLMSLVIVGCVTTTKSSAQTATAKQETTTEDFVVEAEQEGYIPSERVLNCYRDVAEMQFLGDEKAPEKLEECKKMDCEELQGKFCNSKGSP